MTRPMQNLTRTVSTKFIATVAAVSIAVAGLSAAPANAGKDDVVKTIAGLTALFIIGSALSQKKHRRQPAVPTRRVMPSYGYNTLPLQCVRWVDTNRGARRILGSRCIENRVGAIALPPRCERKFRGRNGRWHTGYGRDCLIKRGYRIEAQVR